MVAFDGTTLPSDLAVALRERPYAGATLFRAQNVDSAAQVRRLTHELQAAALASSRPLLVATDQEGGQLNAIAGTTEFCGAMAVGAAGDEDLAERVARATARELRAVGVNVDYAPVCDLATNPHNPGIGIRSFGDDPQAVAGLAAATVRGLQAEGVAATAKHFPGIGGIGADTHHELAAVEATVEQLRERELLPFRAAIEAGAWMVMAGHAAVPSVTGDPDLPSSLARTVIRDLLRDELGFAGLAITDALDMMALAQGGPRIVEAMAALGAGQDLLLTTPESGGLEELESGLELAWRRGLLQALLPDDVHATSARLSSLRQWLSGFDQPSLDVVGCAEHRALAAELARRSITLVRNDEGLLPLRLPSDGRIAVVQPRPADLTPADTSSYVAPALAAEIRRRFPRTDEFRTSPLPTPAEIAGACDGIAGHDLVVLGTNAAHLQPAQAEMARAVLSVGRPTLTVALRTPWDLPEYEQSRTHVCTFGILPPSMEALAAALFGESEFIGRLPVEVGGLYPRGHGLSVRGEVAAR